MTIYNQINYKTYNQIKDKIYKIGGSIIKRNNELISTHWSDEGLTQFKLSETINDKTNYHAVKIRLNPVRLLNKTNPNDLFKEPDILEFNQKFTELVQSIYIGLPQFVEWKVEEIHYAVNIITPNVKLYVKLFQKCNKPNKYYRDFKPKSPSTGKQKQIKNSLYLITKNLNINFYDKQAEVIAKGSDPQHIDSAKNILRIEVQCKKGKISYLKQHDNDITTTQLFDFLPKELSQQILLSYYDKTIGSGDFYSLNHAKKIINEQSGITKSMKNKLASHLKFINNFTNIWEAKKSFNNNPLFNKYVKQLKELNINPVIIPRRENVPFLPNIKDQIKKQYDPIIN